MVSIAKSMRYDGWDDLVFNLLLTKLTALKERKGDMAAKRVLWNVYLSIRCIYLRGNSKDFFFQLSMLRNTWDEFWCFEIEGHGEGYCDFESYVLRQSFDPSVLIFILKSRIENLNSRKVSYLIVWHERGDSYPIWTKIYQSLKQNSYLHERALPFRWKSCFFLGCSVNSDLNFLYSLREVKVEGTDVLWALTLVLLGSKFPAEYSHQKLYPTTSVNTVGSET